MVLLLAVSAFATTLSADLPTGVHAMAEADAVFLGTVGALRDGDSATLSCSVVELTVEHVLDADVPLAVGDVVHVRTAPIPYISPEGGFFFNGTPHFRLLPGDQAVFSIRSFEEKCDSNVVHQITSPFGGALVNANGAVVDLWGTFLSANKWATDYAAPYQQEGGVVRNRSWRW